MTNSAKSQMMDTEPGGENGQYESVATFVQPPAKDQGTFSDDAKNSATDGEQQQQQEKAARGEKTAENIRYGEAISEHGFGGETTGFEGKAKDGAYGKTEDSSEDQKQTRREQGYGPGSGVGA